MSDFTWKIGNDCRILTYFASVECLVKKSYFPLIFVTTKRKLSFSIQEITFGLDCQATSVNVNHLNGQKNVMPFHFFQHWNELCYSHFVYAVSKTHKSWKQLLMILLIPHTSDIMHLVNSFTFEPTKTTTKVNIHPFILTALS